MTDTRGRPERDPNADNQGPGNQDPGNQYRGLPDRLDPEAGETEGSGPARPVDRFRRTAVGSVVAAGLLGLRDALEGRPEREQTAVVSEARTPDDTGPIEVVLDFDRPGHGIVVIRREPNDEDEEPLGPALPG